MGFCGQRHDVNGEISVLAAIAANRRGETRGWTELRGNGHHRISPLRSQSDNPPPGS